MRPERRHAFVAEAMPAAATPRERECDHASEFVRVTGNVAIR